MAEAELKKREQQNEEAELKKRGEVVDEFIGKIQKNQEAPGILEKTREETGNMEKKQGASSTPTCSNQKILAFPMVGNQTA